MQLQLFPNLEAIDQLVDCIGARIEPPFGVMESFLPLLLELLILMRPSQNLSTDISLLIGPPSYYSRLIQPRDQMFGQKVNAVLDKHKQEILQLLAEFSKNFSTTLMNLGVEKLRVQRNFTHQITDQKKKVEIYVEAVKAAIKEDQKNVSRVITPDVQEYMKRGLQTYHPSYICSLWTCCPRSWDWNVCKDERQNRKLYRGEQT